jgi:hypothetical protein
MRFLVHTGKIALTRIGGDWADEMRLIFVLIKDRSGVHHFSPCSNRIKVPKDLAQKSHFQWWRISLPSTNSDDSGATIRSLQCGQRSGVTMRADSANGAAKEVLLTGFISFCSLCLGDEFRGWPCGVSSLRSQITISDVPLTQKLWNREREKNSFASQSVAANRSQE